MDKKICIIQLADKEYFDNTKNCVKSVCKYCAEHNIEWNGMAGSLDEGVHVAYQKPLALLRRIDEFDYVGWMDMDIAITNRAFDLRKYLERQKHDITVCKDPSYFNQQVANSGVVFFKNTNFSKQILQEWWDLRVPGVDKHWRHQYGNGVADQQFLNKLLKKHGIAAQNPHDLNILPKNFKTGDFAIHFMGDRPVDFDKFVAFANEYIDSQLLLDKYWMVYSFQSWSLIDRYYEESEVLSVFRYTPEEIFEAAQKLVDIDVPH
jgi:hypothetical protein